MAPGSVALDNDRSCAHLQLRGAEGAPHRIPLTRLPFLLGRANSNDYRFESGTVSKQHAVLEYANTRYTIRDLQSTNGTFVNGVRISEQSLYDGDVIHLGPSVELGFCLSRRFPAGRPPETGTLSTLALPLHMTPEVPHGSSVREMIDTGAVDIAYQPIVELRTRRIVGYEALGRGAHPDLAAQPTPLFKVAESCGLAGELSSFFRRRAVELSRRLPPELALFLNVHPAELASTTGRFVSSLADLRPPINSRPIVLEIAESAVTDVALMGRTRDLLGNSDIKFAYDDFGAGQSRLIELSEVPPHYLKLDIHLITGIEGSPARQQLIQALLGVVEKFGTKVIAEGIETEATAAVCAKLGCHLGQGFLFGRPGPLRELAELDHEVERPSVASAGMPSRMQASVVGRRPQGSHSTTSLAGLLPRRD